MMRPATPSKTRRETLARLGAAMLALLFAVAQMASLAHQAMVEHIVCPAHGELLHAHREGASPHEASTVRPREASERATLWAVDKAPGGDEHDCCTAYEGNEPGEVLPLREYAALTPPSRGARTHLAYVTVAAQLPLLRLAPKNSPPMLA